jgi:predicted ester cyclase
MPRIACGPEETSMAMDIKTLARECIEELFNRGHTEYLQDLSELSFIGHDPVSTKSVSLDDEKKIALSFRAGFPDLRCSVNDVVSEGSRVVCRWRMTGTHQGSFLGFAPTGRRVAFDGISEMRFHESRLAEQWTLYDCLGLLHQLGVLPSLEDLSSARIAAEQEGTIHLSI